MAQFYLNQNGISLLTQCILLLAAIGYLLTLPKKSSSTWLFLGMISGGLGAILCLLGLVSLIPPHPLHVVLRLGLWLAIQVTDLFMIQFAYHLPRPLAQIHREMMLLCALYLLVLGVMVSLALLILRFGQFWLVPYTELLYNLMLLGTLLWVCCTLWRRTYYFSAQAAAPTPWWRHLWRPNGADAQATRAMALIFSIPLVIGVLTAATRFDYSTLPNYGSVMAFLLMLTFFSGIVTYLNQMPEPTTFLAKLVGISLFALLTILGQVGLWMAPTIGAQYVAPSALAGGVILHFTPTTTGGYQVRRQTFTPAPRANAPTTAGQVVQDGDKQPLPFPFPFYNQNRHTLYIHANGLLTFDGPYEFDALYGEQQPAIAPLLAQFVAGKSIRFQRDEQRVIITWHEMVSYATGELNTFQAVLHRNGAIDFVYFAVAAPTIQSAVYSDDLLYSSSLIGLLPGNGRPISGQVRFAQAPLSGHEPVIGAPGQALIENRFMDFRRYLHQQMQPLAWLITISTLIVLLGFPLFFRVNLVNPLQALVQGTRQVNAGELAVRVPQSYNDEIGFLTHSFNNMVGSIKASDVTTSAAQLSQFCRQSRDFGQRWQRF